MHHRPRFHHPRPRAAALLLTAVFLLTLCFVGTGAGVAQMDDAAMEAWTRAATPGEHHQRLAELAGSWRTRTTFWPQPGAEPMISEGRAEQEMILGGRFLRQRFEGTSMGQPFVGEGITGWDNVAGELVGTWVDNHGTGITVVRGEFAADGKSIVQHGETVDPVSKQKVAMRMVTRLHSPDHHVFDFYVAYPGGEEHRSMSIDYRRE